MSNQVLLALDPATKTGWAVGDGVRGGFFQSGVLDLAVAMRTLVDDGFCQQMPDHEGLRYLGVHLWLSAKERELCGLYQQLAGIVVEAAHHRGAAPTAYHLGIIATVQQWAARCGVPVHPPLHSGTIKKQAAGDGHADKATMIRAAANIRRYYGVPKVSLTDDEADAICALHVGLSHLNPWRKTA